MDEVDGDHFKWGSCHCRVKWLSGLAVRLTLLETSADLCNMVFNVPLHMRPVKPVSGQVDDSLCTQMAHFFVQLLVHQGVVLVRKNELESFA